MRAWIVGGAPRDLLLGRSALDVDVTVSGDVEMMASEMESRGFGRAVVLSAKRPRVCRVAGRREIDLVQLDGPSIIEDLARRDFTVNAVAIDLETGEWIDPFGGLSDLANSTLALVRARNMADDPLRAFRSARFVATHSFAPDRATERAARAVAPRLRHVAPERIRAELAKLLEARRASAAFLWAAKRALLSPALGIAASPGRWLAVARALASLDRPWIKRLPPQRRRRLRLALIAGRLRLPPPRAKRWLLALRHSREEASNVATLLTLVREAGAAGTKRDEWRWVRDAGPDFSDALRLATVLDPRQRDRARRLAARASRRRRGPVVSGSDVLLWLAIAPGPQVGQLLEELQIDILRGKVRSRPEARQWLVNQRDAKLESSPKSQEARGNH